jgi:hypothetical protein
MARSCDRIAGHDIAPPLPVGARLPGGGKNESVATTSTEELRNIRMMHLLERIAERFNDAGVDLMVLKGGALNLTVYDRPGERLMGDLDLLIRPENIDAARELLEELGCLRGEPLVREDFFPRFHYETDYSSGAIYPVRIDLHIRPFRPLRYRQRLPENALWERAQTVRIGEATVQIPSPEDMLIHLATHAAVHGFDRSRWLEDIRRWIVAVAATMDWDRFIETVEAWGLALPVREALERVEQRFGATCPAAVLERLSARNVGWRDRLALRQAPRDIKHPVAHIVVNALCTPGWRFVLAYLWAVAWPDRMHMAGWYSRRHPLWLPAAHILRCLWPVIGRVKPMCCWFSKIETRRSKVHGTGVFTTKGIEPREVIARYEGKPIGRDTLYVGARIDRGGRTQRYEITGPLRFLNHSCRPNAVLVGDELIALRRIRKGGEILIDYGPSACTCRQNENNHVLRPVAAEHAA